MSLLTSFDLAAKVDGTTYSLPREVVAYIDNTGLIPKNFSEDSEAYKQWTFTGRKKGDKETLERAKETS